MLNWLDLLLTLAQDEAPKAAPPANSPIGGMLIPMILIGVLWYFLLLAPQRKEQKRRKDLLSALKKNDKVVTIGGILGTVTNISADGEEVTLRIDDNAKIRMLRSSIQSVVSDEKEKDGGTDKSSK